MQEDSDKKLIEEYYYLIKEKIVKGQYLSAVSSAEKFASVFPDCELSYYLKGICHFMLQEYEISIECYKKVLELNPTFARAYYNLGVAYFFVEDADNAIINIAKALVFFDKRNEKASKQKCIESLEFIEQEAKGHKR